MAVLPAFSRAQEVQLNIDPAIEQLVKTWVNQNRANPRIEGWRLQILSTTDRQKIEAGKYQFLNLYPAIPAEWVHEKPYYKLRVGAFHTRQEAMSFLSEIKDSYPGAYPAKDPNIHPRNFLE
mgnify:FL=1